MNSETAARSNDTAVEREVYRVRDLLHKKQYPEALRAAEELAGNVPENRDVLLLMATSQRFLDRLAHALETLDRLEHRHPTFSLLHEARGHCYVALRDAPRAINALLIAVNINPALPQSWSLLEGLYQMLGDAINAGTAAEHVATLRRMAPEVVRATSLFSDGELSKAEQIVRAHLLRVGNDIEAMRLLGRIGIEMEVFDDAELLLESVLKLAPDYRAARHDYARVLFERYNFAHACEELETLLQHEPDNRQYRVLYASASVGLGAHERAIALYRELILETPAEADLHLSLAHSLKAQGNQRESIDAYRRAAVARPDFGDAYWSLANLKTYRFSDDDVAHMREVETDPVTPVIDRYHFCFALGKAFEDRGDYAESWRYYEKGNALKRAESRYSAEVLEGNTNRQIEICTRDFFESRSGVGDKSSAPIFIVGLPRSGSTLIEQILASHADVEGTHELGEIPRMVLELQGRQGRLDDPRYPGVLTELARDEFLKLGAQYLHDTRVYRTGKPYFIDKMPNNFRHIGLIRLILPNAKIIDARRDPIACCFSNLKQLFANGQEFSYSIEDIARYYRTYLNLMRHWNQALPGHVLRVDHESVVDDLEGNVRRILDFCGLEFQPACLEFYKTGRSVRTASSEQVRQPIFRDGVDQWRNYDSWLAPLKEALGDALSHQPRWPK